MLPILVVSAPFWKGYFLGLQSEPSETTYCYDMVLVLWDYLAQNNWGFPEYAEAVIEKGETATDWICHAIINFRTRLYHPLLQH